ncbi:hypothetical protein PTSG_12452 [Salpingoeca rosetta]|uniref:TNFR-Cys domain-containing protein n=1 Tax=Salpingoeca rosetta (strain ATCC 50818 / BSB-021) TaxID=946362 RepID=F2UG62_SALR5|nr:uncharacterized protein PTSG_12452 [Salpingoeca rosetta]EGD75490.1 hypothetical protein PTSG_12452 [Salpingoeca rosetta]|eukprot:XP_004991947.1 hypothetical protein PTSG_12452 [Salpingoeca rosetta]
MLSRNVHTSETDLGGRCLSILNTLHTVARIMAMLVALVVAVALAATVCLPAAQPVAALSVEEVAKEHAKHSLDFDGTDDWVNLPPITIDEGTQGVSFELVFQHTDTRAWARLFQLGKVDGTYIAFLRDDPNTNGNRIFVETRQGMDMKTAVRQSTFPTTLNTWHHAVIVIASSGQLDLHVDGEQVVTGMLTLPRGLFDANAIGGTTRDARHRGRIALFRMFSKALSSAEIDALFTATSVPGSTAAALLVDYEFHSGFGRFAVDTSGNGKDGQLQGFPLWTGFPLPNDEIGASSVSFTQPEDRAMLPTFTFQGGAITVDAVFAFDELRAFDRVFSLRASEEDETHLALLKKDAASSHALALELKVPNTDGAVCDPSSPVCVYTITNTRAPITQGRWTHVVVTVTASGDARMYVDGSLVAATALPTLPAFVVGAGAISGCSHAVDGCQLRGRIARLRMYERVLTSEEVQNAFYDAVVPVQHPTVLFAFDLREGVGRVLKDSSESAPVLDATMRGYPRWVSAAVTQHVKAISSKHMRFGGGSSILPLEPLPTSLNELTIEMVFRLDAGGDTTRFERVLSLRQSETDATHVAIVRDPTDNGRFYFEIKRPSTDISGGFEYSQLHQSTIPGDDDAWHHVVATVTAAGRAALFADGSLVAEGDVGAVPTGLAINAVGADAVDGDHLRGRVGLVRFYRRALTPNEVFSLMRPGVWRLHETYGHVTLPSRPTFWNDAIVNIEFEALDGSTSVVDSVTNTTLQAQNAFVGSQPSCIGGALVYLQVSTAAAPGSETAATITATISSADTTARIPFHMLAANSVAEGVACFPNSATEVTGVSFHNPTTDAWLLQYAWLRLPHRAVMWDPYAVVSSPNASSISLPFSSSLSITGSDCGGDESLFVITLNTAPPGARGLASAVISGANGNSQPQPLASIFPPDSSITVARCVDNSIGAFRSLSVHFDGEDSAWTLKRVSLQVPNAGGDATTYTWTYGRALRNAPGSNSRVTFSKSDHDAVDVDTCAPTRLVLIQVDAASSPAAITNSTITFRIQGTTAISPAATLSHGFSEDGDDMVFVRCLSDPIGGFERLTLHNTGSDTWTVDAITLTYQGGVYEWMFSPAKTLTGPAGDEASLSVDRAASTANPPSTPLFIASACARDHLCPVGFPCALPPGLGWTSFYKADFSTRNADGWHTTAAAVAVDLLPTPCGGLGRVLGALQLPVGSTLVRPHSKLPMHNTLRIQFDLIMVDLMTEEEAVVTIDGVVVFRQTFKPDEGNQQCGSADPLAREHTTTVDVVIPHKLPTATVAITTTRSPDAFAATFGVTRATFFTANFHIAPVARDVYSANATESVWEWTPVHPGKKPLGITQCGAFGNILGGPHQLHVQSFLRRCFTAFPEHTSLVLMLEIAAIDCTGEEMLAIEVDGRMVWTSGPLAPQEDVSTNACGASSALDTLLPVRVVVPHFASNASIAIFFAHKSDSREATFGLRSFQIEADTTIYDCGRAPFSPWRVAPPLVPQPQPDPPAIEESCAQYVHYTCEGTDDCTPRYTWSTVAYSSFDDLQVGPWQAENEHACGNITVQRCGDYGRVLGGDRQVLAGTSLHATLSDLPAHHLLRVELELVLIDNWAGQRVHVDVDGRRVYNSPPIARAQGSPLLSQQCGRMGEDARWMESSLTIAFNVYHEAPRVTIALSSDLDPNSGDESLGIMSFTIATSARSVAFDSNVVASNDDDDLLLPSLWRPTTADAPTTIAVDTCIVSSGADVSVLLPTPRDERMARTFYDIGPHDLLRLRVDCVMSPSGHVYVQVDDSTPRAFVAGDTDRFRGLCELDRREARMVSFVFTVPHTRPSVQVAVWSDESFGLSGLSILGNDSPIQCKCNPFQYQDASDGSCHACDVSCKACDGPTPSDCLSCPQHNYLTPQRTCTPCTRACPAGQFLASECTATDDGRCEACHPACSTCFEGGVAGCESCAYGFIRSDIDGLCEPACGEGQVPVPQNTNNNDDGGAGGADDDDYSGAVLCVDCASGCSACVPEDRSRCTACHPGYFLHHEEQSCNPTCPTGTYPSSTTRTCEPCAGGCAVCTGPLQGDCGSCPDEQVLFVLPTGIAQCLSSCPEGFYVDVDSRTCVACRGGCADGYYLDASTCGGGVDASCVTCPDGCALCRGPSNCTQCSNNYYLQPNGDTPDGECVPCTTTCAPGTFLIPSCGGLLDSHCHPCPRSCASCSDARSCDACAHGYTLVDGACLQRGTPTASPTTTATADPNASTSGKASGFPAWAGAVIAVVAVGAVAVVYAVLRYTRRRDADGAGTSRARQPTSVDANDDDIDV